MKTIFIDFTVKPKVRPCKRPEQYVRYAQLRGMVLRMTRPFKRKQ